MHIYVRSLESLRCYEFSEEARVEEVMEQSNCDNLQWGGRALRPEFTLADYGIMSECTLEALLAIEGGKRKKKKKVYTTPKKKAHKKKKVKLAVLNIYKVDKSEKVTRTKRACEKCGAGTFMAKHFNRHYCGTCHATQLFSQA
ncbi:unnamed protein product [Blepharisma stoltei]|uniref:Small ribosomal subunit protein eS31 domain-containing protein n=1 Tax=Blepharisma stoltei TaxID=1481888 RepID=A0AAU9K4D0_9CILI|nr:unnamed protein product [Blepharisma stoltei]